MTVSENTQAILLLTAHFTKAESSGIKPLTPKEWGRFAEWLRQNALTPERLLRADLKGLLEGWQDKTITIERVGSLLSRGSALAFAMEKWLRSGLWVMTRSDVDYPKRLKQRLRNDSPAVLFGCGNRSLLNGGGLAVVGSRKVKEADLQYSLEVGARASEAGVSIVSGGAKGVDETAMRGALEAEGTAVGVLADSLLRACSSGKYRRYLVNSSLVLVSPFNPEAGFNTGNAMQRNKYIYCLSDAALAVHSGRKGGTWSGAQEALKREWVPLWVRPTNDPDSGNGELIAAGAAAAPINVDELDIAALFGEIRERIVEGADLLEGAVEGVVGHRVVDETSGTEDSSAAEQQGASEEASELSACGEVSGNAREDAPELYRMSLYELFLASVVRLCAEEPQTVDELADALEITKSQANVWLKRAVADGSLQKLAKPTRYMVPRNSQESLPLG